MTILEIFPDASSRRSTQRIASGVSPRLSGDGAPAWDLRALRRSRRLRGREYSALSLSSLWPDLLRPATASITLPIGPGRAAARRSEEHTSELQSRLHLVCRLLL